MSYVLHVNNDALQITNQNTGELKVFIDKDGFHLPQFDISVDPPFVFAFPLSGIVNHGNLTGSMFRLGNLVFCTFDELRTEPDVSYDAYLETELGTLPAKFTPEYLTFCPCRIVWGVGDTNMGTCAISTRKNLIFYRGADEKFYHSDNYCGVHRQTLVWHV
jgi:hypothetical protein